MHRLDRLYVEIPALKPGSIGAYSLAIVLAACATALRLAIDPVVEGVQYITFFPAVIITTLVSGFRAGFLGVALCAAAAWIFILPPSGQLKIATSDEFVTIAFFIAVASADVLVIGALRLAIAHYRSLGQTLLAQTAELRASEEQQRFLSAEVDHRAKNLLAVVQSILRQTRAADIESYIDTVSGRIHALARSHSLIATSGWRGANVAQIVDAELAPHHANQGQASHGAHVEAVGPPVTLRPAAAQSLAMAIHELTTNAVKHGALSGADGRLSITWQFTEQGLLLLWDEAGGPPIAGPPERRGFGTKIIAAGIEHQLDGRVTFDWRSEGLLVSILVPSEQLAGASAVSHREDQSSSAALNACHRAASLAGRRILVIEDEALIAGQIQSLLVGQGCLVAGPVRGLDNALALARSEPLDAAVLDVNLSGSQSEAVADALRQRAIPFVVLTGYADSGLSAAFYGAPVVAKPFDEEELLNILAHEISDRSATSGRPDERHA
jgi:two-component sensor histidine kinase/CheY-like chemotaxis protein